MNALQAIAVKQLTLNEEDLMRRYVELALATAFFGLGAGCSSPQLYATGQAYQRNQCLHLLDQGERNQCLSKAGTTYDEYKRETGSDNH